MKRLLAAGSIGFLFLGLSLGCAGGDGEAGNQTSNASPGKIENAVCPAAWKAGWQKLADRIAAPVYCPSWLPPPLTGELGGEWHSNESVKRDRSYLMGFIWFERGTGEVHVNLRAYPGRTSIPSCNGRPCFNDPQGKRRIAGIEVERYAVNRGADTWHLLYAWHHGGSLYTVSQHVVPELGLTYEKVRQNLDRIMQGLELIEPSTSS